MTNTSALRGMAVDQEELARELELTILRILVRYNGGSEESLVDWYSALRLGFPQLRDIRQLLDAFRRLSAAGIVTLDRRDAGSHGEHAAHDDSFFAFGPFLTTLTTAGLVHWNTVR